MNTLEQTGSTGARGAQQTSQEGGVTGSTDTTGTAGSSRATGRSSTGRPWMRWVVALLAFPILIAALYVSQLIYLIPGLEAWAVSAPPAVGMWVLVAQYALVLALVVVLVALVARLTGRRLRDTGWVWTRRSLPSLLLGMGVVITLALPVSLGLTAAGLGRDSVAPGYSTLEIIVVGLGMAFLLQGIPEELIFRGLLLDAFRAHPHHAVWISATLFAIGHLTSSGGQQNLTERVLYLAIPFGFGLLAGALALATRSMWAAAGIHAGFHTATLLGIPLGAQTSPTIWVVHGIVFTIAGILLLRRFPVTPPADPATPLLYR